MSSGIAKPVYIKRHQPVGDEAKHLGSLMLIDVADRGAADDFWSREPFNTGGLFRSVEIHRWRFGKAPVVP